MKNKTHYFIIATLFITVFSFIFDSEYLTDIFPMGQTDAWYHQWTFFFLMCFVGASLRIWMFNWTYGLFCLISTYSAFFVGGQHPRCLLTLMQIIFAFAGIEVVSKIKEEDLKKILWAVVAITFAQCVWVVLQSLNLDPIFNKVNNASIDDTVGFSGNHNQIGLFFSMTMPLLISYFPYIIPFALFGLFKSTTSFAVIGALCASVYYMFMTNKRMLVRLVAISIVFLSVFFKYSENLNPGLFRERFALWNFVVSTVNKGEILLTYPEQKILVETNPWRGYGIGNFMRVCPRGQKEGFMDDLYMIKTRPTEGGGEVAMHVYEHAHNDYVEVFFEMGYPGIISVLLIIGYAIFRFIRSRKTQLTVLATACILGQMIPALGIYTVQTAVSGMLLILFLGIFENGVRNGKSTVLA